MKISKEVIQTQGIVINAFDYKENAQIATIYSNSGRFNILFKGSKNLKGKTIAFTQSITLVNINHTIAELSNFIGGEIIDQYDVIKKDFLKTQVALCMLQKISSLSSSITNHELCFNFLKEVLDYLRITNFPKVLLIYFEIKLTYLLGINPVFKKCIYCDDDKQLSLSISEGGVICEKHQFSTTIDLDVYETALLKALYFSKISTFLKDEINSFDEFLSTFQDKINILSKFIDLYYLKYLGYNLDSKKIYYTLCFEEKPI